MIITLGMSISQYSFSSIVRECRPLRTELSAYGSSESVDCFVSSGCKSASCWPEVVHVFLIRQNAATTPIRISHLRCWTCFSNVWVAKAYISDLSIKQSCDLFPCSPLLLNFSNSRGVRGEYVILHRSILFMRIKKHEYKTILQKNLFIIWLFIRVC